MGIEEVPIAPRSPWQNPYCERVIGSIRRDCLDHVIVLNERHLRRILTEYFDYYHNSRPHLSLDRNSPIPRCLEPPSEGEVVAIPQVGGLHHGTRGVLQIVSIGFLAWFRYRSALVVEQPDSCGSAGFFVAVLSVVTQRDAWPGGWYNAGRSF